VSKYIGYIGYIYGKDGKHGGKVFLPGDVEAIRFVYDNTVRNPAPEVRLTDMLDNLVAWAKDGKIVPDGTPVP
jgi:hypothetical protein